MLETKKTNNQNTSLARIVGCILHPPATGVMETETPQNEAKAPELGNKTNGIDKKRLKKLRKRANNVERSSERSGLLTPSEWEDFQKLAEGTDLLDSVGPSIRRRKGRESNRVEGSHHRDLLAWMLHQALTSKDPTESSPPPKKRKTDEPKKPIKDPAIPSWASIHNPGMVQEVLVLEFDLPKGGLAPLRQRLKESPLAQHTFSTPTQWFQGYVPKPMTDSLLHFIPKNGNQKKSLEAGDHNNMDIFRKIQGLTLDPEEMSTEGYPPWEENTKKDTDSMEELPLLDTFLQPSEILLDKAKDWVAQTGTTWEHETYIATRGQPVESSNDVRVFGLDCEMILTSEGSELARITLVQFHSIKPDASLETTIVCDALVRPENTVKNYLTKYSGITAQLLEPVTTRLEQVQMALFQYLRPTDILVGHSLENDLKATRYVHPRVIDTALLFRHRNSKTKFSLKHLTASLLKRTIQHGNHCSEEDAVAAMELAVQRACLGDSFRLQGNEDRHSLLELFDKTARNKDGVPLGKAVCIGPAPWLGRFVTNQSAPVDALAMEDLDAIQKAALAWTTGSRRALLTWCHIPVKEDVTKSSDVVYNFLKHILEKLRSTTIVLIGFQEGYEDAWDKFRTRQARRDPRCTLGWSDEEEQARVTALKTCQYGEAFWVEPHKKVSS
eukprot:Nitzschia sp. Nitz4//scaffold27_size158506//20541//22621//NITZ4_002579-RA/size158506-snap-gene-0.209-mRNA-1//-1//CDS//3329545425//2764//frame0